VGFTARVGSIPTSGTSLRSPSLDRGSGERRFRSGAAFTARASKPGYDEDIRMNPGIVNGETGHPANSTLHFYLIRSP
jgi:hypothetical protein